MARTYRKLTDCFIKDCNKESINKLRSSGMNSSGGRNAKAYDKEIRRKRIQDLRNYARKIAYKLSLVLQE